jgi:hypothetical protein
VDAEPGDVQLLAEALALKGKDARRFRAAAGVGMAPAASSSAPPGDQAYMTTAARPGLGVVFGSGVVLLGLVVAAMDTVQGPRWRGAIFVCSAVGGFLVWLRFSKPWSRRAAGAIGLGIVLSVLAGLAVVVFAPMPGSLSSTPITTAPPTTLAPTSTSTKTAPTTPSDRTTTPPPTTAVSQTLGEACRELRTAARVEASALTAFRSSVQVDSLNHVTGYGSDFEAAYQTAITAVSAASRKLADFRDLGGSLPKDSKFAGDLDQLLTTDLETLHSGARASGNDSADEAWNQMADYIAGTAAVVKMKCSR